MNPSDKSAVYLFSDANFLALSILENLLSKNCVVNIFARDVKRWSENTAHLSNKNKFSIVDRKEFQTAGHYDYAIFCGGFLEKETAYTDYLSYVSLLNIAEAKSLAIFPLEVFNKGKVDSIKIFNNSVLLFVGDLLGPRINLESNLTMPRALTEIIAERKLTLGVGEVFYPIFAADAVKTIVKWLFSFGPYGKTIFLSGSETSGDTFWRSNRQLVGQIDLRYDSKMSSREIPQGFELEIIKSNLNYSLNETYLWLSKNKFTVPEKNFVARHIKPVKPKRQIKTPNWFKPVLAFLLIVFGFPFLTLVISFLISLVAYKGLVTGGGSFSQNSLLLAQTFAVISEKASGALSFIPGIGLVYKEAGFASGFAERLDGAGIHAIPVMKDSAQLFEKVLGTQVYDPTALSQKIESETGLLYSDAVTIKAYTDDASKRNIILANKLLARIDFERFVNLISQGRVVAANLPAILGQGQGKTYLVLFENNIELRPTGGFIGSFGLVSFDGGRLTDLVVNDVYSADGQLNGHVEPPAPIKNYLNEANWWLRDSNWDPDFPTSAKRAEWFLDKELGKSVDGVVAVDLSPIKELLKITGPIFLSDYNLNISSDNLYEKTQNEVQSNFFPGTHQKASFITALSRTLLSEVAKLNPNKMLTVLKSVYASLGQRHVQVYLHDTVSQQAFSNLHWDGAVSLPTCGDGCYADLVGIVEANVGDNKANYFIQRSISLNLNVGVYEVDRKLAINLKNTANPALGPSGKYRSYLRILMPSDAILTSVTSSTGQTQEELSPETTDVRGHKEVGVLVEVLGGASKKVEFSWTTGLNTSSPLAGYALYFRKQAGTDADPISITIKGNGVQINPDPRFGLTRDDSYSYNTSLAEDLFSLFSW